MLKSNFNLNWSPNNRAVCETPHSFISTFKNSPFYLGSGWCVPWSLLDNSALDPREFWWNFHFHRKTCADTDLILILFMP